MKEIQPMIRGVLYIIVCAAGPAPSVSNVVEDAQFAGWDVCVILTPSVTSFVDVPALECLTGHPVNHEYKRPEDLDALPNEKER